jgi:hypothetical protein
VVLHERGQLLGQVLDRLVLRDAGRREPRKPQGVARIRVGLHRGGVPRLPGLELARCLLQVLARRLQVFLALAHRRFLALHRLQLRAP